MIDKSINWFSRRTILSIWWYNTIRTDWHLRQQNACLKNVLSKLKCTVFDILHKLWRPTWSPTKSKDWVSSLINQSTDQNNEKQTWSGKLTSRQVVTACQTRAEESQTMHAEIKPLSGCHPHVWIWVHVWRVTSRLLDETCLLSDNRSIDPFEK